MSAYPPALAAHALRDVTTLSRCWRLTRADGGVSGFTDHDCRLTVDGFACEPQSGFSSSEAKRTMGLAGDSLDIEGALSSAAISEADIEAGALDGATVDTFLVNWRDPTQFAQVGHAVVGKIVMRDGRFVAELESRMRHLDQPNGRYILRRCDAELGDARCGVALGAPGLSGSGTVVSVDAAFNVTVAGCDGFAAGWFANGQATFASGELGGVAIRVAQHRKQGTAVILTLISEHNVMPEAGDAFDIVAGCDKAFETCKAKFSNAANFRGFPHLPGNDHAYSYPREEGIFDGGPVVP